MQKGNFPLWCKRLIWLVFIWFVSVATLGVVAYLLRFIMRMVGMTI